MKTVVTGGAGFIGSHLVERLLQDGHEVMVLDNFSTGRPDNLRHLSGERRLRVVEGDVQDRERLQPCLQGVDWVFHLAALADIVPSVERPEAYFRANVDGTFAVLEAARLCGCVRKFLYAASSSCYGIADAYPTPETAAIMPQYPYALAKNLGEQLVMHWGQLYQIPALSLRLFNVYGPRSRTSGAYGAVFGVFLAQKLAGQPFTVVGDGAQTRDFIFVTDVAEAFIQAAASDLRQQVLNVGSGGSYAINQLVGLLGGDVVHVPRRPGEPDCTFADTAKIRTLLGWSPRVSFPEGVAKVLEQIDCWRDAPVWTPEAIQQATATWFMLLGDQGVPIQPGP